MVCIVGYSIFKWMEINSCMRRQVKHSEKHLTSSASPLFVRDRTYTFWGKSTYICAQAELSDAAYMLMSRLTSTGPDVTEAMLQIPSQDVLAPGAVAARTEEGSDPLLLTDPARPRTGAPVPPLRPRTVPACAVGSHTCLASIWTHVTKKVLNNKCEWISCEAFFKPTVILHLVFCQLCQNNTINNILFVNCKQFW